MAILRQYLLCGLVSENAFARRRQDGLALFAQCSQWARHRCDMELAETSHQKYTNKELKNRRGFSRVEELCPVEWSVLPLVTTTRGASVCQLDGEAEATSHFVALCGAKQGPQGFVADPQNLSLLRRIFTGAPSAYINPAVAPVPPFAVARRG